MKRIVLFTLRHSGAVLLAAALLSVVSVFILAGIKTNFSLRAFDSKRNVTYDKSLEYHAHFNEQKSGILLVILEFPDGLNCKNLGPVLGFCQALKKMEGHYGLLSLAEMPLNYDIDEEESDIAPFLRLYREKGCEFALREMRESPTGKRFFNPGSKRLYFYLRVPFHTGYEAGHGLLREKIQRLVKVKTHLDTQARFVGLPAVVVTFKKIFFRESLWFIIAYILIFTFLFYLHFRDIRLILFAFSIIFLSTLWTLASLVLAGLQMNFFGGLTFLLIYISCTSDIFHLLKKYRDQGSDTDKTNRIRRAVVETAPKSFLTSLSTTVGFGLLFFANVPGLVNFGGYTAIGMMLAFVVTLLLAAPLLKLFIGKKAGLRDGPIVPLVEKIAKRFLMIIENYPRRIISISVLLALAAVLVLSQTNRLSVASFLDLRPRHREARIFNSVEKELGGLMPVYIYFHPPQALPAPKYTGQEQNNHEQITAVIKTFFNLERKLAERYPYADVDGLYRQMQLIAEEDLDFEEFETLAEGIITSQPDQAQMFYNNKTGYGRIILRIKNLDIKRFIADKPGFFKLFPFNSRFKWFVFSEAIRIHDSNLNLVNKFQSSILLGLIFFSALLGIILRSRYVFLVTTFINLLPLTLVYTIAVLSGMPAHVMVVAGFCVSLGIILDDSIYVMMDGYGKLERKEASFNELYMHLFPPLAATTLFIVAGAGIIAFSAIIGFHYFGVILLLSMAGGFVLDIITGMAFVRLRWKNNKMKIMREK